MNVSHPMGVLHSFSIKNIFYDKMNLRLFYFDVAAWLNHWAIVHYQTKKIIISMDFLK